MSLSIIIPCRNEETLIENTVNKLISQLTSKIFDYEIIIINDFSTDKTHRILKVLSRKFKKVRILNNKKKGLGGAINLGISFCSKEHVAIFMADLSDNINDLIKYYKIMKNKKLDAVFGSRFIKKNSIKNYPKQKLIFNRIFNSFVRLVFLSKYNDFTNAFKIYKKSSIKEVYPFVSENFNIFLEIPLKFLIRGKTFEIIPIKWRNRKLGKAKFKIKELGSKYLFTLIYCWLEKILLR